MKYKYFVFQKVIGYGWSPDGFFYNDDYTEFDEDSVLDLIYEMNGTYHEPEVMKKELYEDPCRFILERFSDIESAIYYIESE